MTHDWKRNIRIRQCQSLGGLGGNHLSERATKGCFQVSIRISCPLAKPVDHFKSFIESLNFTGFCCCFIAISVLVLPFVLLSQFFAVHSGATQLCFLPLFARVHHFAKTALQVSLELLHCIPLGVFLIIRYKYFHSQYAYFHTACVACCSLHIQWIVFKTILQSGDVETDPGPQKLDFLLEFKKYCCI